MYIQLWKYGCFPHTGAQQCVSSEMFCLCLGSGDRQRFNCLLCGVPTCRLATCWATAFNLYELLPYICDVLAHTFRMHAASNWGRKKKIKKIDKCSGPKAGRSVKWIGGKKQKKKKNSKNQSSRICPAALHSLKSNRKAATGSKASYHFCWFLLIERMKTVHIESDAELIRWIVESRVIA